MRPIIIHTSDRKVYKRCFQKWDFTSPLRRHLEPLDATVSPNLWFGTGFHWALEDYHGYNKFQSPELALAAFYTAHDTTLLPETCKEMIKYGIEMLRYYCLWNTEQEDFFLETVWIDGKPQVEVEFALELDFEEERCHVLGAKKCIYHGTFDRIVQDEFGEWWVLDYKTVKAFEQDKWKHDEQVLAYLWAAEQHYEREFAGVIIQQHKKAYPQKPKRNKNGDLSIDKRQNILAHDFRIELLKDYGSMEEIPRKYIEMLVYLEANERNKDAYIQRVYIKKSEAKILYAYEMLMAEVDDMLERAYYNRIFPNHTRDCSWDCPFKNVCYTIMEGGDWESLLHFNYTERKESFYESRHAWRKNIWYPLSEDSIETIKGMVGFENIYKDTVGGFRIIPDWGDDFESNS